jgi:hypothetical protein
MASIWAHSIISGMVNRKALIKSGRSSKTTEVNSQYLSALSHKGGAQARVWTQGSIVHASGKTSRIQKIIQVSDVLTYDETEDNTQLVCKDYKLAFDFDSDDPFIISPFLALMENGEEITNTDDTESDPMTAIDAAITGVFSIKIGEAIISKRIRENGANHYIASGSINILLETRRYIDRFYRKSINEELVPELHLGFHSYQASAQKTINFQSLSIFTYSFTDNQALRI